MAKRSIAIELKHYYDQHPTGNSGTYGDDTYCRFVKIREEVQSTNINNLLLEVGCGKGALGQFVSSCQHWEYVGVDFSFSALKHAHSTKKDGASYVCADAHFLPFKKDAVDTILCSEVLEHIPDYPTVLSQLSAISKLRATLLLTTPNRYHVNILYSLAVSGKGAGGQAYDNPPKPAELIKRLKENGFEIESFQNFCPYIMIPLRMGRVAETLQKSFRTMFSWVPLFLFQLYVFVRCRKTEG